MPKGTDFSEALKATVAVQPLKGVRVLSLALNLPGPAAVARLKAMGARCTQLLPPAGDPMAQYSSEAYASLSMGVRQVTLNLKHVTGQQRLHALLTPCDILITSFRPSALRKLGVDIDDLKVRYPRLCTVAIVGGPGERAEEPGHDLTYQAEAGLVQGTQMPPSLLADMTGGLAASEAALQALLQRQLTGQGVHLTVTLADAARWLAWPLQWGLTGPDRLLGGQHAGYFVYRCRGGRVAVAALEPHFVAALGRVVGLDPLTPEACVHPAAQEVIAAFMARRTRKQLEQIARNNDLPLHTLPP